MKKQILFQIVLTALLLTIFSFSNVKAQTITYTAPFHKVLTPYGYIEMGPGSTNWAHLKTDRPRFYFNKEIRVDSGNIGSYNENLNLRTQGSTKMTILRSNGYVGIGTTAPATRLNILGGTDANAASGGYIQLGATSARNIGIDDNEIQARNNGSAANLYIQSAGGNAVLAYGGGNVGIGTTTPDNKLDVKGTIRAEEVIVEIGWSDFVFEEDYDLPTLEEEKQHIEAKGHLIGFESEEDMGGEVKMGEVTNRQQQKIEESVLHLIDHESKIQLLEKNNELLKKENELLKNKYESLEEMIIELQSKLKD